MGSRLHKQYGSFCEEIINPKYLKRHKSRDVPETMWIMFCDSTIVEFMDTTFCFS